MIWRQGGAALDTEIARHLERHRLLDEVRRLKAELAAARKADTALPSGVAMARRLHNNPPEPIAAGIRELEEALGAMLEALRHAEKELEQSDPSPSQLRQVGHVIKRLVDGVLHYCAGLGDAFLQNAAKAAGAAVGKLAVSASVIYCATHSADLLSFAKSLMQLAGR